MKPDETIFRAKKKYVFVMILCFLYAGFSIISFSYDVYSRFWVKEVVGAPPFREMRINDFNDSNSRAGQQAAPRQFRNPDPFEILTSPQSLTYLLGGIVSIIAGITIWFLIREKEIKGIKEQTADNLMLPDEKAVINYLKRSGFESTQAKLAKETGLNKVQVHRVLKRLEAKGIVQKHVYGLTNKIILKKELFE